MTIKPARARLNHGVVQPGAVADVTIIDPRVDWTIEPSKFRSRSRNCPFAGWKVQGWADTVLVGGVIKFTRNGQLTDS